jgi:hypothetical protein
MLRLQDRIVPACDILIQVRLAVIRADGAKLEAEIVDRPAAGAGKAVRRCVGDLVHLRDGVGEVGSELVALAVREAVEEPVGGSAGEVGVDEPVTGVVAERVYEEGGGDGGGVALDEAERGGLVEVAGVVALCVDVEGEIMEVYVGVFAVFVLGFVKEMLIAEVADEFGDEEPDGAGYALCSPTVVCY